MIASTDCGLGGRIHPDIAWAKLEAIPPAQPSPRGNYGADGAPNIAATVISGEPLAIEASSGPEPSAMSS